jgi:hypothetical protein
MAGNDPVGPTQNFPAENTFNEQAAKGFRLIHVCGYGVGSRD